MHEDLFVNEPIFRAMDVHNNHIGMELFMRMLDGIHRQFFETSFFIEPLLKMADEAVLISQISDIERGKLVIIEDKN